ncbi:hypothetical protein D5086_004457 [Populus alba]|uniref:Uncharacterized protein n=1 Tax=Populus alba TaxID=43335 RepID=A0ACC4CQJ2_POPAL
MFAPYFPFVPCQAIHVKGGTSDSGPWETINGGQQLQSSCIVHFHTALQTEPYLIFFREIHKLFLYAVLVEIVSCGLYGVAPRATLDDALLLFFSHLLP